MMITRSSFVSKLIQLLSLAFVASTLFASVASAAKINEIRIDQGGSDVDEYFEIAGPAGESLDGLSYVVVGDDSGSLSPSGVVEAIISLDGLTIPADGFLLVAEDEDTFGATADLFAADLINFENSDNVTHALVRGLDASVNVGDGFGGGGTDLDTDDDGTLDVLPFTELLDSVSLVETTDGSGELIYGEPVGPDGNFVPAHIYRLPDATGTWTIGTFNPEFDTPGVSNIPEPQSIVLLLSALVAALGFRR